MMQRALSIPLNAMAAKAAEAAALMKALSNEHRLLVLCHLAVEGELPVGALVERVGLSQSALSQHLAKLREERLVDFRRDAQTLFYRVSDPRAGQVLAVLHDIFCPELGGRPGSGQSLISSTADVPEDQRKGD